MLRSGRLRVVIVRTLARILVTSLKCLLFIILYKVLWSFRLRGNMIISRLRGVRIALFYFFLGSILLIVKRLLLIIIVVVLLIVIRFGSFLSLRSSGLLISWRLLNSRGVLISSYSSLLLLLFICCAILNPLRLLLPRR
jgi:hypothetical protein